MVGPMNGDWRRERLAFLSVITAPAAWIVVFFVIPLAVIWAYSFGRTLNLTEVAVTGTLDNYARVLDPVYLMIFAKSLVFAGVTTAVCLLVGFPYALVMTFASARGKIWLLLGIMLLTNGTNLLLLQWILPLHLLLLLLQSTSLKLGLINPSLLTVLLLTKLTQNASALAGKLRPGQSSLCAKLHVAHGILISVLSASRFNTLKLTV